MVQPLYHNLIIAHRILAERDDITNSDRGGHSHQDQQIDWNEIQDMNERDWHAMMDGLHTH